MRRLRFLLFPAAVVIATGLAAPVLAGPAVRDQLIRDILRQQSAAERSICGGVKRTLATGRDPVVVVRTAVELGYNPCQVIRCAIEGEAELVKVLQGAAYAGVAPDVLSRCALEAGSDPAAVAAVLADLIFDPNYCYFSFGPVGDPPDALPPEPLVVDRDLGPAPQYSPFSF